MQAAHELVVPRSVCCEPERRSSEQRDEWSRRAEDRELVCSDPLLAHVDADVGKYRCHACTHTQTSE